MNWFRKLFTNPNTHIAIATAATVLSAVFPQYALPLQAVAGALGVTGIALPEQPAAPIEERPLPTLHTEDYAALAVMIAKAIKAQR